MRIFLHQVAGRDLSLNSLDSPTCSLFVGSVYDATVISEMFTRGKVSRFEGGD